jgi:ligand-binding sensor domain-containing protein
MLKYTLSAILLLLVSTGLKSQRHYFVSFSVKEGLAQSQVRAVKQTSDGYLWIATAGGLSRFDGHEFKTYNKSNGLPNNLATSLFETSSNELWAACKGSIVIFSDIGSRELPLGPRFSEVVSNDIAEYNGAIYLASNGKGLLRFQNDTIDQIDFGNDDMNFIRALSNHQNQLYIGTKNGLLAYRNNRVDTIIPNISVSSVFSNVSDVWVTTYGQGLYRIHNGVVQHYTENDGLRSNNQREIHTDKLGNPWIIFKNGIDKLNLKSNTFSTLKSFDPIHTTNLRTIYRDFEGNMWIGTDGFGILKYTGDQFETYTIEDGLSSEIIMDIKEDHDGNLFFATYGSGMIKMNSNKNQITSIDENLLNFTVWSILILDNNDLLIGTSSGINHYRNGVISEFEFNDSLPWPRVSNMFLDSEKKLWIGTRDGILVVHNDKIVKLPKPLKSEVKEVKSFTEVGGKVWMSSNSGLYSYNHQDSTVQHFSKKNGTLPDNYIFCLDHDLSGNLWLGTEDGVIKFNPETKSYRQINLSTQVSSNIVNFILNEDEKQLWLGTDNGLFSLDLLEMQKSDQVILKKYNEHDGVIGQECNQNAVFQDSKNNIWFGTNGGLIKYDPLQDNGNYNQIQNIHITDVASNFESVFEEIKIDSSYDFNQFKYTENRLSFRFTAIHHNNPEKVVYSYKLVGSDADWSPQTKENFITYANLSPGQYKFIIRAKLDNGEWSAKEAHFEFEIQRPFWMSWWFGLLIILAAAALSYIVYLQVKRERNRKKQFEELQNKSKILGLEQQTLNAHMNRHFIFNALNSIQYYINTQDRKMANMYLSNFAALVRKNLDSAQEESIYLKDELERLRLYMNLEQMRFKDRFDFKIDVEKSLDIDHILVPSMILQPFVENSIMHGILPLERKGTITISIRSKNNDLSFDIKGNGIGIETSMTLKDGNTAHHVSNGMKITKQRMALLNKITSQNYQVEGPRQITDETGKAMGTSVLITLPIKYKNARH